MATRIEHEEFVHLAVNLQDGRSMRADHNCGGISAGTLMISRQDGKLSAYCFRCQGTGVKFEAENFQEKLARHQQERDADKAAQSTFHLPSPQVHKLSDWPKDAALWVYRAGFSPSMIEKLGAYWCPSLGRVVLPVMDAGVPVFWQARSTTRKPKIISPKLPRRGVIARYGTGETLVLCEDTLSAFKVGQVTEAWSLMGVALTPVALTAILERQQPVAVWLDSDGPGQAGAREILKTLRAYGIPVRNVTSPKDPKMYSQRYIKEKLA